MIDDCLKYLQIPSNLHRLRFLLINNKEICCNCQIKTNEKKREKNTNFLFVGAFFVRFVLVGHFF